MADGTHVCVCTARAGWGAGRPSDTALTRGAPSPTFFPSPHTSHHNHHLQPHACRRFLGAAPGGTKVSPLLYDVLPDGTAVPKFSNPAGRDWALVNGAFQPTISLVERMCVRCWLASVPG